MEVTTQIRRMRIKLMFIILATFGFIGLKAQHSIADSIIILIEANKQECPLDTRRTSTESCDSRWIRASQLFDRYYYTNDTNFTNYIDSNSEYILEKHRPIYRMATGSVLYMKTQINNYKISTLYHAEPPEVQFDTAVYHRDVLLMKYFANTLNIQQLISKIIHNKDSQYQSDFYSFVMKHRYDEDIPVFYSDVIDSTLNDIMHYTRLILRIKKCKLQLCDSIFNKEYLRFDSIKDLSNIYEKVLWEDIFNRGQEIRDSLSFEQTMQWQKRYDDSLHQEFIKEQLRPITKEEYLATLDSNGLRQWRVMNDTTLWYTGNLYTGDDGTNFLTWSNDSLLAMIKSFNLDSLYNLYINKKPTQKFKAPAMFYFWKTTQVIGDRLLDGRLVLNPADSQFLHNMVQYYADVHCDTANLFTELQDEAKDQLLRLWPLLKPHFYVWINTPGICYRYLAIEILASAFTEDMVLYLIDKIDHPSNAFEQEMKLNYWEVLQILYGIKDPKLEQFNYTIPPRRPTRSYQQTQDWIDRLIEPMRLRNKLPIN